MKTSPRGSFAPLRGRPPRLDLRRLARLLGAGLFAASLAIAPALAAVAGSAPEAKAPAPAPAATGRPRSLGRVMDPVVVTGAALEKLAGKRPAHFQLFAYRIGRGFVPISFQVDERDSRGRYVFLSGPDTKKDEDGGLIDSNDELVFMAADSGDEAGEDVWNPAAAGGAKISVRDPVDEAQSWAYLLPRGFLPETSPTDYVILSEKDLEVSARDYLFRYCRSAPIGFEYLAVRHGQEPPVNIVDRLKIRAWAKVLGMIKVSTTEADLQSSLRGSIDGPVRVIRRSRNAYELGGIIPTIRADAEATFYPNHFLFNLSGKMPFDADKISNRAQLRVVVDYTKDIAGATFYTGSYEQGVLFDGKSTSIPTREELSRIPYQWGAIYGFGPGKRDGWFSRMIPGPTIPPWFDPYVVDNDGAADPPEREPGVHGIGFISDRMVGMKGGDFWLESYLYRLDGFDVSQVPQYLNVSDKPLEAGVEILRVNGGSSEPPPNISAGKAP